MKSPFNNKKAYSGKMHIFIALGVFATLWYVNSIYEWFVLPSDNLFLIQLILITMIYGMVADIDSPISKINQLAILLLIGIILYSFYNPVYKTYGISAAIIIGLLEFINHREMLHTLIGGLILSAPLLYLGVVQFIVGLIAFLSHIVAEGEFNILGEKEWRLFRR